MGERVGYARVSTRDQNLDMQIAALESAGCTKIFEECLDYLREGDILVVWKLDRLSRSLHDLINRFSWLSSHKIALMSIKDNIDVSTASGRLVMNVFASLAEFERDLLLERTSAGRIAAMKRGVRFGRPEAKKTSRSKSTVALYREGLSVKDIMQQLNIKSSSTVYRFLRMEGMTPKRKPIKK
jgi:DNA invertase Pin-like site-specific DNA recombinase